MRRTIDVLPVNEIVFKFRDRDYLCTFNLKALGYMQQELQCIGGNISHLCTERFAAIILYSGIRANDDNYTIEEANALTMSINPSSINQIIELYNESNGLSNEMEDTVAKKILAQILTKMAKLK